MRSFTVPSGAGSGTLRGAIFVLAALAMMVGILVDRAARAADEEGEAETASTVGSGQLVRLPLPITGRVDDDVKRAITRALARLRSEGDAAGKIAARPTLILEFSPGQSEFGGKSDFSRALSLARFLTSRELSDVKTVAYIPRSIKGHAVLVAMACDEIVMAPDAHLGEAGVDEDPEQPLDETVLSGYQQIAARRRTIPVNIALGMLDKRHEVLKVETEDGAEFVMQEDLDDLRRRKTIQGEPQVLVARGELGNFKGHEARALGIVRYLAPDRMSVARALNLDPASLVDAPLVEGDLHAALVMVVGKIDSRMMETRRRMIEGALEDPRVNMICLWIDSPGGEAAAATRLANYLSGLDPERVLTVAYIPEEARGMAAIVALSCQQVVMRRPAQLGGGTLLPTDAQLLDLRAALKEGLLPRRIHSWSLPLALVDARLPVHKYVNVENNVEEYFSADELAEQPQPTQWQRQEQITLDGQPLTLSADDAERLGLVRDRGVVETFEELKSIYGLENDPTLVEPSWVDSLVRILASPGVAWLLLLIGLAGMYAEVQMPGIGIGGFLAAVAFVLFFWANYLEQTADVLEIVLFITGVTFLLLEVFVIPGFGIFGLGGGLMVIMSLILASQTFFIPRTPSEVRELRDSLLVVGGAGVGFVAVSLLMRRLLPRAPLFERFLLEPPQGEQAVEQQTREALVNYRHLIGKSGVTTTQLTPSGKARFGEELIDVISDGQWIAAGTPIVVTEVHGSRVIVEEAPDRGPGRSDARTV